jgi:FKBP-type peptidyl-prolyl cis-trans isomerases 2
MTEQVLAEQRIGQNTEVTLHFALRLENGDTVDSTFDKAPATFKVGDGNLLPGFEAALFGFKAGDKRTLTIEPENALVTEPAKCADHPALAVQGYGTVAWLAGDLQRCGQY